MDSTVIVAIIGIVVSVIVAIIGALATRVLMAIDKNQKDLSISLSNLWVAHNGLSMDFCTLTGEYYVTHPAADRRKHTQREYIQKVEK